MNSQRPANEVESLQETDKEGLNNNGHNRKRICNPDSVSHCRAFHIWPVSKGVAWAILRRIGATGFFWLFPPARFYVNVLRGIETLRALAISRVDNEGKPFRVGSVQRGGTGFDELVKVLKENDVAEGEVQEIALIEVQASLTITGISAEISRVLVVVMDGKQERIPTDPFDPNKPIRELREWIDDHFRRQLAYYMMLFVVLWLLLNSLLIYWLNR